MVVTELITLGLAIVAAYVLYKIFNSVVHLAINAVLGIAILLAAKFLFGVNIAITILPILICAIAGILGAIAVLALHFLNIAF